MTTENTQDNTWRTRGWDYGTVSDHAQRFAMRLEKAGLEVRSRESGEPRLSWPEVVQAFADCAEDAVDQHVRNQRGKAEAFPRNWDEAIEGDAHEGPSESPQEAHGIGQAEPYGSMIIRFINGAEEIIHMHHPMIAAHGWTFRQLQGIPYLVMGHAMNRRQYPLCNIAFIQLSPEEL